MENEFLSLLELQTLLRDGVEDMFPGKLWILAEVSAVSVKPGGHCYLELCQSEGGRTVAKCKAAIWRSRYLPLAAYFREVTGGDIKAGMELLMRVSVSYSELYGMTLTVDEIEPRMTVGDAELQRRRTIERLTQEGLLERQKSLELPLLPYRLAVISASGAAGYGDFMRHLTENEYGFVFETELFEAAMQGEDAPASITDALMRAESAEEPFDAALILRGGGSVLDLACFDDYGLCFSIANCSIPVFTAIGHDRDHHVADMVSCGFVKTPTALADLFIDAFAAEDERISSFGTRLRLAFSARVSRMEAQLDAIVARIRAADPRGILSRGYVLVTDESGIVLKSAATLASGKRFRVMFADGSVDAVVE